MWTIAHFTSNVRYQIVPAGIAQERLDYIQSRYGSDGTPSEIKTRESVHLDFGGMLKIGSPKLDLVLESGLKVTVFKHHDYALRESVEFALKSPIEMYDGQYIRFTTMFHMVYMSVGDAIHLIAQLAAASKYGADLYRVNMAAALENANNAVSSK